jgi:hypothetical protein
MSLPIEPKVENQGLTQHGRLTAAEFNLLLEQINKNTPQPVASEEALEQMIQDGSIVEGQIYYIPEE